VAGHFIEINLGIAIAATRTYFWTLAALVVLLGKRLVPAEGSTVAVAEARGGAAVVSGEVQAHLEARRRSKRRRGGGAEAAPARPLSLGPVVESALAQIAALGVVGALILSTMSFNYTTNSLGLTNPFAVIITALTTMSARKAGDSFSPAMAWLVLMVFVVLILVIVAEVAQRESKERDASWWLTSLGVAAGLSGGLGLLYALIHAARLRPGADISQVAYEYYALMLALWALLAVLLFRAQPRPAKWGIGPSALIYLVLIVITVFFVDNANISMIKADILYKQGLRYDQEGSWDNAILLYTRALQLAPSEDFYHLFRGRALMERGKQEKDVRARDAIFGRALEALNEARRLNPLNTDHTANQARLHRTWGEMSTDATQRSDHFKRSLEYYAQATQLSPNNAQLYNEWGLVLSLMGENDLALAKYEQSLTLDSEYLQTYFLLGDLYLSRKQWPEAIQVYSKTVAIDAALVQGWSSLGYAYSQVGDFTQAISANLQVLAKSPSDYNTLKNLTILYNEAARPADALTYAEKALAAAPDQDKATLQSYVQQLRGQLGKEKS
jgi:tetratricopeptide (TPR) repeat protein